MLACVLGRLRGSIIKVLRRFAAVLRFVRNSQECETCQNYRKSSNCNSDTLNNFGKLDNSNTSDSFDSNEQFW